MTSQSSGDQSCRPSGDFRPRAVGRLYLPPSGDYAFRRNIFPLMVFSSMGLPPPPFSRVVSELPPTCLNLPASSGKVKLEYRVPEIVPSIRSAFRSGATARSIKPLIVWALIPAIFPVRTILPLMVSTEISEFSGM